MWIEEQSLTISISEEEDREDDNHIDRQPQKYRRPDDEGPAWNIASNEEMSSVEIVT